MHDFDRRPNRFDMRLRQRAPAAADGVEIRPSELARQAASQSGVNSPLGLRKASREHRLDRQRAERQTDRLISDMVVDRLRHFETAAAHVPDRPDRAEEPRDDAERREPRLFSPAEDANLEARLRTNGGRQLRPVRGAADGFGPGGVDFGYAHGVGNGPESPDRLNGAAKPVRRDGAGLGEPVAEPAKRFLVEARHRRPAELVIDHEPDRIRADIDNRIGRPGRALGALGIEIERA